MTQKKMNRFESKKRLTHKFFSPKNVLSTKKESPSKNIESAVLFANKDKTSVVRLFSAQQMRDLCSSKLSDNYIYSIKRELQKRKMKNFFLGITESELMDIARGVQINAYSMEND